MSTESTATVISPAHLRHGFGAFPPASRLWPL
jgi:hypothetical protein